MASNTNGIGQFIETKLTKGEAIDLLIMGLKEELLKGIHALDDKIKRLPVEFAFEDVMFVVPPSARVKLATSYDSQDHFRIDLSYGDEDHRFPAAKFPPHIRSVLEERVKLNAELSRLRSQLHKLEDKKTDARSLIMATMLESTPEGRKFLQLIGDLRLRVQPKLALAAKNS